MSCQCTKHIFENKLGKIACTSTGKLEEKEFSFSGCEEDLVEKLGICTPTKLAAIDTETTWTQIFIPEVLCIPEQKPDVEQVITVTSTVDIMSTRVIKTPKVENAGGLVQNYEGTFLTGRKLIIEGVLRQRVIYTADVEDQSVHSAHFDVPFSVFVVLPEDTDLFNKYKIEPCIEDIFICRVTSRQIFKNVTLFIKATKLTC